MHEFLYSEEKNELQELMQKKEDIVKRLEESENELVKQRESVSDLISDLEHGLQCSTIEMLQVRLQEVQHLIVRTPGSHFSPSVLL